MAIGKRGRTFSLVALIFLLIVVNHPKPPLRVRLERFRRHNPALQPSVRVEKWHLAWFIPKRSRVRVPPLQPVSIRPISSLRATMPGRGLRASAALRQPNTKRKRVMKPTVVKVPKLWRSALVGSHPGVRMLQRLREWT